MTHSYQLSEYELQRLERIRKNEEYLESLGLKHHKSKLKEMTQKTKRNRYRANNKRKSVLVSPGEERRSSRIQKNGSSKLVMLSYTDGDDVEDKAVMQDEEYTDDDDDDDDDDATSPTGARPTRPTGTDAERPSPAFRSARRTSLNREDFVLTSQEKETLSRNTMDSNYLHKFQEFLVYHNKISDQNVRQVMRQVRKLSSGEGVHYDSPRFGWKPHQVFQQGVPVTPLSDFVELLELAKEAEDKWGRDHGNGWLLTHPLKKMLLFQQFCLQNPDFLLAECKLKEYYMVSDEVSTTSAPAVTTNGPTEDAEDETSKEIAVAVVEEEKKSDDESPPGDTTTKQEKAQLKRKRGKAKKKAGSKPKRRRSA